MKDFPEEFILLDTEFTSWEGAEERNWSGPNEYREIVQIGAISVSGETFEEQSSFSIFVKSIKNPILSDYFKNLTKISQEEVDSKGVTFDEALKKFYGFVDGREVYSFGKDGLRLEDNAKLLGIDFLFSPEKFHNLKEIFKKYGIETEGYMSSTIIRAFGKEPQRAGHDALNDVRLVLDALKELKLKLEKEETL